MKDTIVDTRRRAAVPLCVDLDGTLIRTDMLAEALLVLLKQNPLYLLLLPLWLLRGRAALKDEIASRIDLDAGALPYNEAVLDFLRQQRAAGRELVLATGSHVKYARAVAAHHGLFDHIIASDRARNITGRRKGELLCRRFGERGFDYIGNAGADLPVWRFARQAITVDVSNRLARRAAELAPIGRRFTRPGGGWRLWGRQLRLQQWLKNLLLFVPLLTAHRFLEPELWGASLLAFFAFSFGASAVYVINDLFDLAADRRHPLKKDRPLAAGTLSIFSGIAAIPLLLGAAAGLALLLPAEYGLVLAGYFLLSLSYSLVLKRLVLVDVIVLASLYALRLVAGATAIQVEASLWLLLFSLFFFLSLGFVKRSAELTLLQGENTDRVPGRGYWASDLDMLKLLGAASAFMAVLVFAFYINSDKVTMLYRRPPLLWLEIPILLYWLCRMWLLTHRGQMHDDPVFFAARDKASYAVAALMLLVMILAI